MATLDSITNYDLRFLLLAPKGQEGAVDVLAPLERELARLLRAPVGVVEAREDFIAHAGGQWERWVQEVVERAYGFAGAPFYSGFVVWPDPVVGRATAWVLHHAIELDRWVYFYDGQGLAWVESTQPIPGDDFIRSARVFLAKEAR